VDRLGDRFAAEVGADLGRDAGADGYEDQRARFVELVPLQQRVPGCEAKALAEPGPSISGVAPSMPGPAGLTDGVVAGYGR